MIHIQQFESCLLCEETTIIAYSKFLTPVGDTVDFVLCQKCFDKKDRDMLIGPVVNQMIRLHKEGTVQ